MKDEIIYASAINTKGEVMFPFKKNRMIGEYSEGLAPIVQTDSNDLANFGRLGFINHQGELVIPYSYMILAMHGIHYPRFENGKAQVINFNTEEIEVLCIDIEGKEVVCDEMN